MSFKIYKNLILQKTSGTGIQVDTTTPTFGWADLVGSIHTRSPATEPTWSAFRSPMYAYKFPTAPGAKEVFVEYHIGHDYVPGTDIYIHAHWGQNVVDTGGAAGVPGVVKWYWDISYADGYGTPGGAADPFVAAKTISVTQQGSTTQYGHMIAEVVISGATDTATTFDRTKFKVDGIIVVRCYRDAADAADTLDQAPFIFFTDCHYQTTGLMGTKDKNSPFYT
jgi:hypothetical protein